MSIWSTIEKSSALLQKLSEALSILQNLEKIQKAKKNGPLSWEIFEFWKVSSESSAIFQKKFAIDHGDRDNGDTARSRKTNLLVNHSCMGDS